VRAQLALFFLFGVLGTLSDQIHVQFDVLSYATPVLFGQAIWVPLLFGVASLAVVNSAGLTHRMLGTPGPRPSRREVLLGCLEFLVAYFATGIFREHPVPLGVGLGLAWLAVVAVRPSWDRVVYGLSTAVAGPAFEAALSSTGQFTYHKPDFAHVPLWLPGLYLHVAVLGRVIYLAFFAPEREVAGESPALPEQAPPG
jgi:hypothetical protein